MQNKNPRRDREELAGACGWMARGGVRTQTGFAPWTQARSQRDQAITSRSIDGQRALFDSNVRTRTEQISTETKRAAGIRALRLPGLKYIGAAALDQRALWTAQDPIIVRRRFSSADDRHPGQHFQQGTRSPSLKSCSTISRFISQPS
jgi:hypothetical protein